MPRLPKFIHPVRAVRIALSEAERVPISQKQFGDRLGLSGSYIQRIELGKLQAPDTFCRAVAVLAGVKPETLRNAEGKPLMRDGKPVTPEAVRYWKEIRQSDMRTGIDLFCIKHAELAIAALGLAAMDRNRCDVVMLSFSRWLHDIVKEFGLLSSFVDTMQRVTRKWNHSTRKRGGALLLLPNATTDTNSAGAFSAMRVDNLVKHGEVEKKSFTVRGLRADLECSFSP
jgi:hypothetical protein